ncbi:hypothetical protein CBR_g51948 [Chara braunii]|uniref:RNA polymerase II-associated protein 3 n=1 Tax=Chara braunii TaxID=69332 RepID=A0A388K6G8_CHABU|nr:hypothetical protein CBR_g51948 [Chara braunii]|eukprot:GBG65648.1 hypothetical protein CBR_g51948 [Chara braunii]
MVAYGGLQRDCLSDQERREFDNITYDKLQSLEDIPKLRKLEAYMREEGFAITADTAKARLEALGAAAGGGGILSSEERGALAEELCGWEASVKDPDAKLKCLGGNEGLGGSEDKDRVGIGIPAIRPTLVGDVVSGAQVMRRPSQYPDQQRSCHEGREKQQQQQQQSPVPAGGGGGGGERGGGERGGGVVEDMCKKTGAGGKKDWSSYYDGWDKYAKQVEKELEGGEQRELEEKTGKEKTRKEKSVVGKEEEEDTKAKKSWADKVVESASGMSDVERLWLAEREREKGNEMFKSKDFRGSIDSYTLSLRLSPSHVAALANRAAAYLKLKRWEDAEIDCNGVLEMDPKHVKALMRRAYARAELQRPTDAWQDIEAALALDPSNVDLQMMKGRISKVVAKAKMQQQQEEQKEGEEENMAVDGDGKGQCREESHADHREGGKERLKESGPALCHACGNTDPLPAMTRMVIEESDEETEPKSEAQPTCDAGEPAEQDEELEGNTGAKSQGQLLREPATNAHIVGGEVVQSNAVKASMHECNGQPADGQPSPACIGNSIGSIGSSSSSSSSSTTPSQDSVSCSKSSAGSPTAGFSSANLSREKKQKIAGPPGKSSGPGPVTVPSTVAKPAADLGDEPGHVRKPKNATEFELTCRKLGEKDAHELATYLRVIHVDEYPRILQDGLSASTMAAIGAALDKGFLPNDCQGALTVLIALSKVRRFKMTAMLLPPKDKNTFASVFDCLLASPGLSHETLETLRKEYRV